LIRILSAAALIALLVVTVWWLPPIAVIVLAVIVAALGAWELAGLARASGAAVPGPLMAILAGGACLLLIYPSTAELVDVVTALVFVAGPADCRQPAALPDWATVGRAALLVGGPLYLAVPLALIVGIYGYYGPHGLSTLALMVIASDSAQYFTGRALGRRKLAPLISPAKTIEGAIGGLVAAAAVGAWLINWARPHSTIETTLVKGAVIGVAVAIAGMLGDLFESALKRRAASRDSSPVDPGPRRRARSDRQLAVCRAGLLSAAQSIRVKRIAILGSTGSIGRSALAVVDTHRDKLEVVALAAGENAPLLADQIAAYRPKLAGVASQAARADLVGRVPPSAAGSGRGAGSFRSRRPHPDVDIVLCASSGTPDWKRRWRR
jgi:phosphatidate cytidylyltransferase